MPIARPSLRPRLLAGLALLASGAALVGCGQSQPASSSSATAPPPPRSTGLSGNGSLADAPAICRGFVSHLDRYLARGIRGVSPQVAASLFSELEGLSRRVGFLDAPAGRRAALARWAADLDSAATIANRLAAMDIASAAARSRYATALDSERAALERANAGAARLGLRSCHIAVPGR